MINGAKTETIKTPYGIFAVDGSRDIKLLSAFKSGHYHQEDVLNLLHTLLPSGGVFVDAGAHIGTISIPLSSMSHVISFEASPETFEFLMHNIGLNSVNVDARNKGLAAESGVATLLSPVANNAGANTLVHGKSGEVVLVKLDDEVQNADVIKIDVEGMELEVLVGGSELIARSRPAVLFEINLSQLRAHGTSPAALEKFFREKSYSLYIQMPSVVGAPILGRVESLPLITFCIAPRSWLFGGTSAPFDIVALPKERLQSFKTISFAHVITHFLAENIRIKLARIFRNL